MQYFVIQFILIHALIHETTPKWILLRYFSAQSVTIQCEEKLDKNLFRNSITVHWHMQEPGKESYEHGYKSEILLETVREKDFNSSVGLRHKNDFPTKFEKRVSGIWFFNGTKLSHYLTISPLQEDDSELRIRCYYSSWQDETTDGLEMDFKKEITVTDSKVVLEHESTQFYFDFLANQEIEPDFSQPRPQLITIENDDAQTVKCFSERKGNITIWRAYVMVKQCINEIRCDIVLIPAQPVDIGVEWHCEVYIPGPKDVSDSNIIKTTDTFVSNKLVFHLLLSPMYLQMVQLFQSTPLVEGNYAAARCETNRVFPKVRIRWLVKGREITCNNYKDAICTITQSSRNSHEGYGYIVTSTINIKVQKNLAGAYTCFIETNSTKITSYPTFLGVKVQASQLTVQQNFSNGYADEKLTPLEAICITDSLYLSDIWWEVDDITITCVGPMPKALTDTPDCKIHQTSDIYEQYTKNSLVVYVRASQITRNIKYTCKVNGENGERLSKHITLPLKPDNSGTNSLYFYFSISTFRIALLLVQTNILR